MVAQALRKRDGPARVDRLALGNADQPLRNVCDLLMQVLRSANRLQHGYRRTTPPHSAPTDVGRSWVSHWYCLPILTGVGRAGGALLFGTPPLAVAIKRVALRFDITLFKATAALG